MAVGQASQLYPTEYEVQIERMHFFNIPIALTLPKGFTSLYRKVDTATDAIQLIGMDREVIWTQEAIRNPVCVVGLASNGDETLPVALDSRSCNCR